MAMPTTVTIPSGKGALQLTFTDVAGNPVTAPDATFTFVRVGDRQEGDPIRRPITAAPITFNLDAFPLRELVCRIETDRFRFANTAIFRPQEGKLISRQQLLIRAPKKWQAVYTAWDQLPDDDFAVFKQLLSNSPNVKLRKNGPVFPSIAAGAYDAIPPEARNAKTALLNLRHRLFMTDPISRQRTWLSFIKKILEFDQERIIAVADSQMALVIEEIRRQLDAGSGEFPDYEKAVAENHRPNVPQPFRDRIQKMSSIKSSIDKGNLQLTVSRIRDMDDVILDADIDENGETFKHLLDALLVHPITGGTHPHDIHEILVLQQPTVNLGYSLA